MLTSFSICGILFYTVLNHKFYKTLICNIQVFFRNVQLYDRTLPAIYSEATMLWKMINILNCTILSKDDVSAETHSPLYILIFNEYRPWLYMKHVLMKNYGKHSFLVYCVGLRYNGRTNISRLKRGFRLRVWITGPLYALVTLN